jgi:hypothetical protein
MGNDGGRAARLTVAGMALMAAAVTLAWFIVKPHVEEKRRFEEQRNELARRVARERAEVDELNGRSLRFETDPEFVEHEARRNHRVFPGETEFVFDAPE